MVNSETDELTDPDAGGIHDLKHRLIPDTLRLHRTGLRQQELNLPVDESKFMIGIISRLTDQKGLDLVRYALNSICDENTQFVVITHRRGTMEAADVLYGVTMQERGVSRLISMKLEDVALEE